MSSRIIVKNIPTNVDETKLKEIFSKFGSVTDAKICLKGSTHRRFCFIGYKSEDDAKKAQGYFNNTYIQMNKIQVDFAKTADDPSLHKNNVNKRRAEIFKNEEQIKKKIKFNSQNEEKKSINSSELTAEQKFQEFKKLMQNGSKGTMSWNDVLTTIEAPKNAKSQKKGDNNKKNNKDEDSEEANAVALQDLDQQFEKIKKKKEKQTVAEQKNHDLSQKEQPEPNQEVDSKIDSCRLYVLNLPYDITEEEVRLVFKKYGTLSELKMPKGKGGQFRGFAYVTYSQSGEAMRSFAELDNKIQFGRILHIRPAFKEIKKESETKEIFPEKTQQEIEIEKSSFKKKKKSEMKKNLGDDTNWNTLFLNPNTILEVVAQRFGVKKSDILSPDADNQAVRIAHAETQIIAETKEWMQNQGINLDFLEKDRKSCERSDTTIIIKNLSGKVQDDNMRDLFSRYGQVDKFLISPNKSIGIVQYYEQTHALNAFEKLSYFSVKNNPLYLEWAPIGMLDQQQVEQEKEEEQQIQDELSKVLYIKNINFNTTEAELQKHFEKSKLGNIRSTRIVFSNGKSQGYGFIEFNDEQSVGKAIRQLQNSLLQQHSLNLSVSKPSKKQQLDNKKIRKQKNNEIPISTKIVIRNLAFEATKKDIIELLKTYGELKATRLPKKMNGQHRGFAFAEFSSAEEAKNAFLALENTHLYGRKLAIEWAKLE